MKNLSTDSIQFGEGNFMRAFVDYCIQLLNEETEFKGKVNVVQPIEKGTISDLKNKMDNIMYSSRELLKVSS